MQENIVPLSSALLHIALIQHQMMTISHLPVQENKSEDYN